MKTLVCNPFAEYRARRKSTPLFRVLDEADIKYDEKETVTRAGMLKRLFPWAYCRFTKCSESEFDRWIEVKGLDNLIPLVEMPEGILLITCHFGPGHIGKYVLGKMGYTVYNVRASDRFVRRYGLSSEDERFPNELYAESENRSEILKMTANVRDLLRRGKIVTCALDGKRGISEGMELPLLGRRRPFRLALPLAAALTSARILPYFASLRVDGSIEVRFEEPFPQRGKEQPPLEYAKDIVESYVDKLQAFSDAEPSQINLKSFMNI